jgi:hypothetical protein
LRRPGSRRSHRGKINIKLLSGVYPRIADFTSSLAKPLRLMEV